MNKMFNLLNTFWVGTVWNSISKQKKEAQLPVTQQSLEDADFGEMVVIGDESAGKSFLWQRFLELPIFQIGEDIITRQPLRVRLRFSAVAKVMRFMLPNKPVIESNDPIVIHDALKASHDEIEESGQGISEEEAILEIFSPNVPNLDAIDLPGMFSHSNENEDDDLPATTRALVKKYIEKPNIMVLYVVDGKAYQRNSPAAGLLREIKPATVIKVFTKVDCLRDERQAKGPLASFLAKFDLEGPNSVALVNYKAKEDSTFEDMTLEETRFFEANLKYDDYKQRVGMQALRNIVNKIAEQAIRPAWAESEHKQEAANLAGLETELKALGPEYKLLDITHEVVTQMTKDDPCWERLAEQSWMACGYVLPKLEVWTNEPVIDINLFLIKFQAAVQERLSQVFRTHLGKLQRYSAFYGGFWSNFKTEFNRRTPQFLQRWQIIATKIMLDHDTSNDYKSESWLRGAKCCLNQTILIPLADQSDLGVGPVVVPLCYGISNLMKGLSCEENDAAKQTRSAIVLKIATTEKILQMLPIKANASTSPKPLVPPKPIAAPFKMPVPKPVITTSPKPNATPFVSEPIAAPFKIPVSKPVITTSPKPNATPFISEAILTTSPKPLVLPAIVHVEPEAKK